MSETLPVRNAKIRRAKANFVIEENVDAVIWPHECSACGKAPAVFDQIKMEKKFKNLGMIKTNLSKIPYCESCFKKIKATKRLDKAVWILALVFGIPLGILFIGLMHNAQFICLGALFALGIAIAWGVFYLLIRFPIKSIFKNRYVEYVDAWLIEEKKSDQSEGLSVVVTIPNKAFAEKFVLANAVPPEVKK